jgi:type I restriction enzyme R subunit
MATDEFAFESEIAGWLTDRGGYAESSPAHFDAVRGIDTSELFTFIGATQAAEWERLVMLHGGDQATAQRAFADRLAKELDSRGTVDVLRRGVVDLGGRSGSRTSGPPTG